MWVRGGAILDMLVWRNVSVPRTLNCWLWECTRIICRGSSRSPLLSLSTSPHQLMQRWLVKSSAPPPPNCRLNIRMRSWSLQVILIMPHWTTFQITSTNMLTAPPDTIKHWICYMLMPWTHMTPQPFMMTPKYVSLVRRQPVHTRTVRKWTHFLTAETLQDCFESTDWDVLCEPHGGISSARTPPCQPRPFTASPTTRRSGRGTERECSTNWERCWGRAKTITGESWRPNSNRTVWGMCGREWSTSRGWRGKTGRHLGAWIELTSITSFSTGLAHLLIPLRHPHPPTHSHCPKWFDPPPSILLYNTSPSTPPTPSSSSSTDDICTNPRPTVTTGQVKRQMERLHQRKAAGPDGISPRILKTCASQLSPVLGHLYNLSLSQEKVLLLWKTTCLVPVPKKSRPSDPADYRPVALTSHVMKVLEKLVLAQLRPQVRTFLDPLQFAYQPHLGVNDAVIYLLQQAHMHLDGGGGGGTVRIAFFDFSSAFNNIQPLLMGEKLWVMGVDDTMISWITDYLTGRPQFVRLGSVLPDVVVSDTGASQGTVLSPFLFTLYTTDFQYNSESCHLQKFSDDSAVVTTLDEQIWVLSRGTIWCVNLLFIRLFFPFSNSSMW